MLGHHRTYDHSDTPVGGTPPAAVDPAQESLSQALRAGFNVLRVIIVVLLFAYFLSGWFQVEPGQQGVIVRFGKLRENDDNPDNKYVFREGWHASLPDPFDEKIRLKGQNFKLRIDSFCPVLKEAELAKELSDINLSEVVPAKDKFKPGVDGTMLTGDRNLSHGLFAIEYRIEDAAAFVQNVGETPEVFERLLKPLAENAILRTVAGMPVERVIRTQTDEVTGDFTDEVKKLLNDEDELLTKLETGVVVINVEARTVEPGRVREAFLAVSDAKSERKEREDEARQEAHRVLSRTAGSKTKYDALLKAIDAYGAAQAVGADEERLEELRQNIDQQLEQAEGEVATRLRQAQSRANEIRERVQQEYKLFVDYLDMYRKYPQLTLVRRWVRMRDAILSSAENEIFFVPEAGEIEILVNRDPLKLIEADLRRFQERTRPPAERGTAPRRRGRP